MATMSLWNFFEVVKTEWPRYVRCTLCGKNLSRGSEIKKHERKEFLKNHFQDKHSELLSKDFASKKQQTFKAEKLISSRSHLNQKAFVIELDVDSEEAPLYFNNSTNGDNKPIESTENYTELSNNSSAKDKSKEIPQSKQPFKNYFKVSDKDKSKVECILCGSSWIPQVKSGIRNHLKTQHFNEFLKVAEESNEIKKKRSIEDACNIVANFNYNKKQLFQEKLVRDHGTSSDKPIGTTVNFKELSNNSSAKDKSIEIPQSKQSFRNYFKVSNKDKSKVECTLCGSCWIPQVKSGIRNHLKTQHFNEFLKFNKIVDECDERQKKIYVEEEDKQEDPLCVANPSGNN